MESLRLTKIVNPTGALPWRLAVALLAFGFLLSIVVIIGFAVQNHAEVTARKTILSQLGQLTGTYRVRLNGRDVGEPALLMASIRRVGIARAHHSHPTAPIHVEIRDEDRSVKFVIARDSERPDEYWVFRPGENMQGEPLGQEAGRISDMDLGRYLHRWGF